MDKVKFAEDNLLKQTISEADHFISNFLKAVFHIFYLLHS